MKKENTNTTYNVQIAEASKELTVKERIQLKDTSGALGLNEATDTEAVIIDVDFYATLDVHNEKAQGDKDYKQYILVDKSGQRYATSSTSFWNTFIGIADEVSDAGLEEFAVKVYKKPSKNYKGKSFITCSLV
jgi:hypothetical protein